MNNVDLSSDDISRYSRQLLLDDIDETGQANIKQAYAVVIGLGGLGSLVARYLVGAGIGKVLLVDSDTVEKSNIHRQVLFNQDHIGQHKTQASYAQLRLVNPYTQIELAENQANSSNLPSLISGAHCVLDCSDNITTRKAINAACVNQRTALFIAAASQYSWQAINLRCNGSDSGCYACLLAQTTVQEDCMSQGILGPVVGMAACFQATQALLYLASTNVESGVNPEANPSAEPKANSETQNTWGKYYIMNAATAQFQSFSLPAYKHCEVCQCHK
ncbi:HesA/MoeB/ThiF family protein [Alteromonas sp. 1_MG-2023]|uniref:HesA/MoeB/ThiF family protein n=1 Tax=Alteromonas sp. 1_MG-2023 TaxID=3062669 RepID=UPI0026E19AC2|nr:HesA/MoeB/ThiF family protein [Alteromonas sp. 1_MG-2023]MDO6566560.1 HesA/MoeB/ThiF family protein [Alteromonas sp. 1_MG-2023]